MTTDGEIDLNPENVEDFPRPPALETALATLRVELDKNLVAETSRGLRALETFHAPTYYFPRSDIRARLIPVPGRTFCEWKGVAQYFDVAIDGVLAERAAWTYEKPSAAFKSMAGYVAFYASRMTACFVNGVRVLPQPGDFYGGWVTPNLHGQIKGGPGTRHW